MFSRETNLRYQHLKRLQRLIRYRFRKKSILDQSLTPKSYCKINPDKGLKDNERLEFLGDAVLNVCISSYLYKKYPFYNEGNLTQLKNQLVSFSFLLKAARRMNISDYLRLPAKDIEVQPSALACGLEALIAAVYLDGGFKRAYDFILANLKDDIRCVEEGKGERDYKSLLQEVCLRKFRYVPKYETIKEEGPQHKKNFTVSVNILGSLYGIGTGRTKKEAHQLCAKEALKKLKASGCNSIPLNLE